LSSKPEKSTGATAGRYPRSFNGYVKTTETSKASDPYRNGNTEDQVHIVDHHELSDLRDNGREIQKTIEVMLTYENALDSWGNNFKNERSTRVEAQPARETRTGLIKGFSLHGHTR
jgi:hypothetical protein